MSPRPLAITVRADQRQTSAQLARDHCVEVTEFLAANHLSSADAALPHERFLILPYEARLPHESRLALAASGDAEIEPVLRHIKLTYTYQFAGRKFFVGTLLNRQVVATVTGGGLVNASIGTTTLLNNFRVERLLFMGIAGSIEKLSVGDVCVPSLILQHDLGTWFDQEGIAQEHGSLLWQSNGIWVWSNDGRREQVGLKPDLDWVSQVAERMKKMQDTDLDLSPNSGVRKGIFTRACISASGSQFVLGHDAQVRLRQIAELARVRDPSVDTEDGLIVNQEDIAFAVAAEENATPWIIIRIVVDTGQPSRTKRRLPATINTSEEGWAWLESLNEVPVANWKFLYEKLGAFVIEVLNHETNS